TCNRPDVSCAGLGNNAKGIYSIHIVNNGPDRDASLSGLPGKIKTMSFYTTDKNKAVKKGAVIKVQNGKANFHLEAVSYTTLLCAIVSNPSFQ
ncbi:MAG: hypothetical protein M3015_12500, partial [Bacteroidota bacterium]|nr:hypothetical protein [Bacteroidota bacterium]